ncbi:MAG: hypothetical protein V4631_10915 [Pseudomonadota bacterium]
MSSSPASWNQGPDNGRTLIIEPVIEKMDFKNGAQRVMFGAMAGGSAVLLRFNIHDANGRVIASREFYQRVAAMDGAFAIQDNLMLGRIAQMAAVYMRLNYTSAVGGPTGGSDPR